MDRELLLERASKPLSMSPRPFLRWAGSKRFALPTLATLVPEHYRTYYEPFLGGGSLFFLLRPERAMLSDKCSELISTFSAVRDNVSAVARYLAPLRPSRRYFYKTRRLRSSGRFKRAAEFIYLNKTCWNGLYRVNSDGLFNVPYGMPKSKAIVDIPNLRGCASHLRKPHISIKSVDFEVALEAAGPRDLVYLDPPYVTRHNNNGFIDYNETLFSWQDQERLAARAKQLARSGAYVIVTNAGHHEILELYKGFRSGVLTRSSTLASNPRFRVLVQETVLYSRNCPAPP